MELRQLRYFVAVAEELHFGRAARRMRVSQPPLSRQISALERELGVTLLNRTSRRVELTTAGHAFLNESRQVLGAVERATSTARTVAVQPSGVLRLGFVHAIGWPLKSSLIRAVLARYPGITPALQPASTAEQIRAIRARQLDVGVIWETVPRRQGDTDLDRLVLREDPTQLSLAPTHPLAHRKRVSLERLSDELLLLAHRRENPEAHDDVIAALKRNHVRPRLLYSDGSAIIDLVAAGVGVSFISAASPHMRRADIVSRPLNPSLLTIQMVMVWEQGNSLPALQGFLEVVAEMQEAGQVV